MEEQHPDKNELFRKYLINQCSEAELKTLFRYLSDEDFYPGYEKSLKQLWEASNAFSGLPENEGDQLFARAMRTASLQHKHLQTKNRFKYSLLAAASISGILILAIGAYFFLFNQEMTDITTAYGETKEIILPDSSVVTLNANSSLSYPDWDEKNREVWLSGEAFFVVKKKTSPAEDHPGLSSPGLSRPGLSSPGGTYPGLSRPGRIKFTVHTEGMDVEVLGTQFNVRNRHDATEVVLNSGKVRLNFPNDKEIFMEPGDLVAYSLKNNQLDQKKVNPEIYTSWRNKVLLFEESSLGEIASVLQDNYGFDLKFQNPEIANLRFTTQLSADEINLLFPMLEESFNLKVIQNGKQITLQYAP